MWMQSASFCPQGGDTGAPKPIQAKGPALVIYAILGVVTAGTHVAVRQPQHVSG